MAQIDESGYVYYKNRHIDVITIGINLCLFNKAFSF